MVTLKFNKTQIEFRSNISISDGRLHKIKIDLDGNYLTFSVDEEFSSKNVIKVIIVIKSSFACSLINFHFISRNLNLKP